MDPEKSSVHGRSIRGICICEDPRQRTESAHWLARRSATIIALMLIFHSLIHQQGLQFPEGELLD